MRSLSLLFALSLSLSLSLALLDNAVALTSGDLINGMLL